MEMEEQNRSYEESLREDMEREFQAQLKQIEELSIKEEIDRIEKDKSLKVETPDKKPTKEELRILRMKFYIGNNNDKNTK